MTSLLDPPCLIEHEIYVENTVWILHMLSTRECSSNERLRPRGGGGGGGTMIFSYLRRRGQILGGSKFRISIYLLVFRKMNIFGGYEEYFLGVLEIPDIFWRGER